MSPTTNMDPATRLALLEQAEKRDVKDFEEYKMQNAKEHDEIKEQIGDGFNAQTAAIEKLALSVDTRLDDQDIKIIDQGERIDEVEDKQKKLSTKTKLIWGGIVFLGTAVGGALIKWGVPVIMALL
jgi:hypothetical protein